MGGLGFAPNGNIGDNYALFEPTYGSGPKNAGKHKVNPTAMNQSTRMMLDWCGESEKSRKLEDAIAAVIRGEKVRTYDMGGDSSTQDMANEFASKFDEL